MNYKTKFRQKPSYNETSRNHKTFEDFDIKKSNKPSYKGMTFDSGMELKAYQRLELFEKRIQNLVYHPDPIIVKINNILVFSYQADFSYFDAEVGKYILCEFKGYPFFLKDDFKLKMRILGALGHEVDVFVAQSNLVKYWTTSKRMSDNQQKVKVRLNDPRMNIFGDQRFHMEKGENI
jgi:hypothetical protein